MDNESLADLRQHTINGWVAYGAHQMDKQTAEHNLDTYESHLIRKVETQVTATIADYIKNHSLMTLNRLNGKYRPMSVGEFRDELLSHITQQDIPYDEGDDA